MDQNQNDSHDERGAVNRRRFMSAMAVSAGAAAALGQVAAPSAKAVAAEAAPAAAPAAGAPPRPRFGDPVLGTPPPAGQRQQPQLTDLKGKTVYITGGNTGIGLGIARAAANAGMNVVMGYIQEDQVEPALKLFKPEQKSRVIAIRHDVTDRDGWVKTLAEINAKFGNLHLLVNNAGIKTLRQASQVDAKGWDAAVAVNFTGIYNGCAAVIPHMIAHKEGSHIVTTSSMGGILPGVNAGVYTATKFAACGIMEALRVELMGTNIGTSVFTARWRQHRQHRLGRRHRGADDGSAGSRRARAQRREEQRPVHLHASGVQAGHARNASTRSWPRSRRMAFPEARAKAEVRVLTAPPYAPEIVHRSQPRKSYRV